MNVQLFLALSIIATFLLFPSGTGIRIAIIGGGIGGASSAYFLRKLTPLNIDIEINLFNDGEIGGRVKTVQMLHDGKMRMFEAGGSVLHPANLYFKTWMEEFGLHKKEKPHEKGTMGIWNGQKFVFLKSSWYLITLYRLLRRYGIDPLKVRFEIKSLLSDFENIYKLFDNGQSYDTMDAMAMAMSSRIAKLVNITSKDHLTESGYCDPFIAEYTGAALSCDYGQSVEEVHGFVGSVVLAGSVAGLYSVSGSNKLVVEKLIDYSKPKLISAKVATIERRDNHFILFDSNGEELGANYDYVILAVPLHQKQHIQITDVSLEDQRGNYKQIISTFVEGSLRPEHWSMSWNDMLTTVLACNISLPYNSIAQVSPVDYQKDEHFPMTGSNRVWKVFSSAELTDSQLAHYFSEIKNVTKISFLAYPEYKRNPTGRPRFRLAKDICYVNAVEWLASTIEMSAIGGRNCINMFLKDFDLLETNKTTKTEL